MFEDDDFEESSLDDLLEGVENLEENMYIADGDKAVSLVADLIRRNNDKSIKKAESIEHKVKLLFNSLGGMSFDNKLELYERFMSFCARLSAQKKIKKLKNKVVIGFGGMFSSGKSCFINSFSGIGNLLPDGQAPTTSIPTYIIKSPKDSLTANSVYGYTSNLTTDSLKAITHEFYDVYGIAFSSFVDCIIAESSGFSLSPEIALLDTPGYSKYDDDKSDAKTVITDREKAFAQLSISDYLIWLIDIDRGGLVQEDIAFLEELKTRNKVLIVFNKADKKAENDISEILSLARETIKNTSINCFGITAYSSIKNKEYGGDLIPKFIKFTLNSANRSTDVVKELYKIESMMKERINRELNENKAIAHSLFNYISKSRKVVELQSLSEQWKKANNNYYRICKISKKFDEKVKLINKEITNFVGKGE